MALFDRSKKTQEIVDTAVQKALQLSTSEIMDYIKFGTYDDKSRVHDPYNQIPTVYACVKFKALNLSRVPLKLYKGDKEVESGPAFDLLHKPNPQMALDHFLFFAVSGLNLRGNAYSVKDKEYKGLPVALWPALEVTPKTDKGLLKYYEVMRGKEKVKIAPEEMVHARFPSPFSVVEGHAPITVLRLQNELSYASDRYNAKFFENDATPPLVFRSPVHLDANKQKELEHKLIERRKGANREAMIITGDMTVESVGMSQKDAEFVEMSKLTRGTICSVFGLTESDINFYADMKYSNSEVAAVSLWENTLIPEGEMVAAALSDQVFNAMDMEVRFDFGAIESVHNKGLTDKITNADKLVRMGVPWEAVNDRLNLGFEDGLEVALPQQAPEKPEAKGLIEDRLSELTTSAHTESKWFSMIKSVDRIEARMAKALKDYYHQVEKKILQAIGTGKGSSFKVTKDYDEGSVRDAFDDDELAELVREFLTGAIITGASEVAGVDIETYLVTRILEEKTIKVVTTNATSRDIVISKIRSALSESLEAGDGYETTARKVRDALKDAMKINRGRAEMIARTEIGGAFNQAGYEASVVNGAIGVRWISAHDGNVRASHVSYDGQVRRIGDTFGPLEYPHDPSGPAHEVINCRCMLEPVYDEEELP